MLQRFHSVSLADLIVGVVACAFGANSPFLPFAAMAFITASTAQRPAWGLRTCGGSRSFKSAQCLPSAALQSPTRRCGCARTNRAISEGEGQPDRATLDSDPLLRKRSGRRQVRPENQAESQLIRCAIFSRRLLSQIKNRDRLVCEVTSVRLPAETSAAARILSMQSLTSAR